MAGLLAHFLLAAAFPSASERKVTQIAVNYKKFTAAGTAPEFPDSHRDHRIPFLKTIFGTKVINLKQISILPNRKTEKLTV